MTVPIRFAIFDMDGLLLDTERAYLIGIQEVLSEFGHDYSPELRLQTMGKRARESAAILIEALDLPVDIDTYLARRSEVLNELFLTSEPMPGAVDLIHALHGAGIPLAVGTSSGRDLYDLKTRRHQALFDHFSAVVTGDDPDVNEGKPAPDIFLVAATRIGADPEQTMVFEDSPIGVQAARAAGMRVTAVPDAALDHALYTEATDILTSLGAFSLTRYGIDLET